MGLISQFLHGKNSSSSDLSNVVQEKVRLTLKINIFITRQTKVVGNWQNSDSK